LARAVEAVWRPVLEQE
jgi:hypothetical protein